MYYIRYYSKPRNKIGLDVEKEIAYNRGRIITKVVELPKLGVAMDSQIIKGLCVLDRKKDSLGLIDADYNNMYTEFRIPKKKGGYRVLHAPDDNLKEYQKAIARFITDTCRVLPDNAVHSYTKHRNCKTAIETHQKYKSRWFLKLDIHNFFDNIHIEKLSNVLSRVYPLHILHETVRNELLIPCFLNDSLPQGSPVSPVLSNLYLSEFDNALRLALGKEFCYTRYADDILISSRKSFGFSEVVTKVDNMLHGYGLSLNKEKTRYGSCNGANWNLGLMYNQDLGITVGYRHKHIIKCMVHNLYTHKEDTSEWIDKERSLLALLGYYKFIEPEYFTPLIKHYKEKGYLQ